MIKRIILLQGAVETLEFFSRQMARTFAEKGIEVFFWDLKAPLGSREQFERLSDYADTVLITFNFIGLSGESQFSCGEGRTVWDACGIPCVCIMVDHPMYYYDQLCTKHENWTLCCVDRDHCRFVERFYPFYGNVHFVPLAGTGCLECGEHPGRQGGVPEGERKIDLLFAGNYVALTDLLPRIAGMDAESRAYYFAIADELIAQPGRKLEDVILEHLRRDFPEADEAEFLPVMHSMVFIDLYVRSFFRREIVCSLAEAGLKVAVIGKDWEKSECKRPQNLIRLGQMDSRGCLLQMQRARLSLNLMPWFKNGAHDRIFNAMLQGCAVVTDSSAYLDELLTDGKHAFLFSLEQRSRLPDDIRLLLADSDRLAEVAKNGHRLAADAHTWKHRAQLLLDIQEGKRI